ncbi:hypothetical protein OPT61_g5897 [Boeremia exigua]|uniref:Uncharacterized protein n=1 Tax=Boeremia exigua TaxID=749465 RepID=A0ACC2I8W6_9PLEO|nr:hypothetical protein OPT61_g5897 [Boeremia exigua]
MRTPAGQRRIWIWWFQICIHAASDAAALVWQLSFGVEPADRSAVFWTAEGPRRLPASTGDAAPHLAPSVAQLRASSSTAVPPTRRPHRTSPQAPAPVSHTESGHDTLSSSAVEMKTLQSPAGASETNNATSETGAPQLAPVEFTSVGEINLSGDTPAASSPAAPASRSELNRTETEAALGPSTDGPAANPDNSNGPTVVIMLLLTTGARHPYKIDEKYLKKRNVTVEEMDPYNISVYTLKELIWRDWREEWEPRPTSPSSIRLIHFGRMLDDKSPLKDCRFQTEAPNVVHMTIKPQEVVDDEENAKTGKTSKTRDDGEEPTAGCRCVILLRRNHAVSTMVLQDTGNPSPDSFSDNPASDNDPYASQSSPPSGERFDSSDMARPIPIIGPFIGFSQRAVRFKVNTTLQFAEKKLGRTLSPDEAQALASHIYKLEKSKSYYSAAGVAGGVYRWYATMATYQYPFYKPKLESIDPNKFGPIKGPAANLARQTWRFGLYALVAGQMGDIIGQLIAQPMAAAKAARQPSAAR